jgi:release factor glutamine methyltransferase
MQLSGQALQAIAVRLAPSSDTPSLDAQVLLAQILERSRSWVLAHPEAGLDAGQAQRLESAVRRLEAGEPLPYVLGHWEFFGLDFEVTPAVLIPRPETELLVEQALSWLQARRERQAGGAGAQMAVDLGTGSGCIAISLAVQVPELHILACDVSLAALHVAARNTQRHQVAGSVFCIQADLLPGLRGALDLVCANLPYIPSAVLQDLPVGRSEPWLALDGGADGLVQVKRLLGQLQGRMAAGGLALLEIEASQGRAVQVLAKQFFPGRRVQVLRDLAGLERLLRIDF